MLSEAGILLDKEKFVPDMASSSHKKNATFEPVGFV